MRLIACCTVALLAGSALAGAASPPQAPRVEHWVRSAHGDRLDEYHWLRDDDPQRKRPEVMRHLRAENAYTAARLAPLEPRRRALLAEMRQRVVADEASVPRWDNGYWYQERYRPGAEHPQLWRRPGPPEGADPKAPEQLVLDMPAQARGQPYYAVGAWTVSPDGRLLAWTEDTAGQRRHTLHVRDLATGRTIPTRIQGVLEDIAWANDSRTIFHIRQDSKTLHRGAVWWWRLGGPAARAEGQVHDEPDRTLVVNLQRSVSGKHLLIHLDHEDISEVLSVDLDAPQTPAVLRVKREPGVRVQADHLGSSWVLRSNRGAPDYALWLADETNLPEPARWLALRPHRPGQKLERFRLHEQGVAFEETANAEPRVRWIALPRLAELGAPLAAVLAAREEIAIGGLPGHTARLDDEPQHARAAALRWTLSSMVLPRTTLDFDPLRGTQTERKRERVPGFDAALYASDRFWAAARDGTRVPVTLAWRRDRLGTEGPQGRLPLLVRGYGAYGLSFDPEFRPQRLSLLDRGFVLAIAHVRGGSELGEAWYRAGRMEHKRNSFNDFIDATQALIDAGWGDANRVFAEGGSAGGLLMGVVAHEAPRLYRGIVMQVPFLDVVSSMLDASLPLTEQEWTQWGDPRRAEDYARMLAYSPYDQIRAQEYPPMLVTAGLWDAAVSYHEPAKYVARMRAKKTDSNPLLLHTEMSAGHGGASGRYAGLETVALWTLFVIDLAQVQGPSRLAPTTLPPAQPPRKPRR